MRKFIITSCNTPKLLDFLPKILNQMAFFIQPPVALALLLVRFAAWDVGYCPERLQPINEVLAVIAFVRVYNAAID